LAEKTVFLTKIKHNILIIAISIISIIILLGILFYVSSRNSYEERTLANVLGRQGRLTQMMATDTSRLFVLVQAKNSGSMIDDQSDVDSKIDATKQKLLNARDEFAETLSNINKGYIEEQNIKVEFNNSNVTISSDLHKMNILWENFDKAVNTILGTTNYNEDFIRSSKYIIENNELLLEYCDSILDFIVKDAKQEAVYSMFMSLILVFLALIVIGISVLSLYKYIIMPLNEIYKGFFEMGVQYSKEYKPSILTNREIKPIVGEISSVFHKMESIISLIENINNSSSFGEVLDFIFKNFSSYIPYNHIGVAIVKGNGKILESIHGISDGSVKGLPEALLNKGYEIKGSSLEKIFNTGEARIINDLHQYTEKNPPKEYTKIILAAGIRSSITLPLKVKNRNIGVIFFSSKDKNVYTQEHCEFLKVLANSIAITFEKNIFVDDLLYSSLLALAKLAEARDEDTADHLERMKKYARLISELLYTDSSYRKDITPEYINAIERFSPMHDIGKVGIRDAILLKPGKLTSEEFEEMKLHAEFGAEVLRTAEKNIEKNGKSMFKLGIEIAEGHHEKWDGSGYPNGKAGEEIPLSARIVAVADVFDALTSRRPYKESFPFETSFNMIIEGSGKHFDPEIVRVFEKNKDKIYELYKSFH